MTLAVTTPGSAGVTSSTEMRDYRVTGTNATDLVGYMKSNPFPGDEGPALANIRQSYALSVNTKDEGGVCRASSVDVNIHFVMTLPKAADAQALVGSTRAAGTTSLPLRAITRKPGGAFSFSAEGILSPRRCR